MSSLTHNAGAVFDSLGNGSLDVYAWNAASMASQKISESVEMEDIVNSLLTNHAGEVTAFFASHPEGGVYFGSWTTNNVPIHFSENAKWPYFAEYDLHVAFGHAMIPDLTITISIERENSTDLSIASLAIAGTLVELYDFDHEEGGLNSEGAVLQIGWDPSFAGHGAGNMFFDRVIFMKSFTWGRGRPARERVATCFFRRRGACAPRAGGVAGEADDDAVDVGFFGGFAVPAEGAVSEVDGEAAVKKGPPEGGYGFALADGVGGDEGGAGGGRLVLAIEGFFEPGRDVVEFAVGLEVGEDSIHVGGLLGGSVLVADERRVADDVVESLSPLCASVSLCEPFLPVHSQRVAFADVDVGFQGEEVEVAVEEDGGPGEHLGFGDPEGRAGDGYGEVVDFDAVELLDGDADGVFDDAEEALALEAGGDGPVFEAAEGEVGFGQEVARAARRAQERRRRQLVLKGPQAGIPLAGDGPPGGRSLPMGVAAGCGLGRAAR